MKSLSLRVHSERSACFVFVCFLLLFRLMVGREALGAYVGGLGPLLGPMLAVLDRFWGLCCWSWAALGASVRGLRPLLSPLLAVLGCLGPKSGPGLSGKAIWKTDQGRKVAQTRAGRRSGQAPETLKTLEPPKHPTNFFVDTSSP